MNVKKDRSIFLGIEVIGEIESLSKLSKALKVSSSLSTARGRIVHNGEGRLQISIGNCSARYVGVVVDVSCFPIPKSVSTSTIQFVNELVARSWNASCTADSQERLKRGSISIVFGHNVRLE